MIKQKWKMPEGGERTKKLLERGGKIHWERESRGKIVKNTQKNGVNNAGKKNGRVMKRYKTQDWEMSTDIERKKKDRAI